MSTRFHTRTIQQAPASPSDRHPLSGITTRLSALITPGNTSGARSLRAASLLLCLLVPTAHAAELTTDSTQENTAANDEIAALQAKIEALEKRIEGMESERATLRAPFAVVDDAGQQIFVVEATGSTGPRILLGNATGAHAEMRILHNAGAVLNMTDAGNKPKVSLFTEPGKTLLSMSDSEMVLDLGHDKDNTVGLGFARNGKDAVYIYADETGGTFTLNNKDGKPSATMTSTEEARMVLFDEQGKVFFNIGVTDATGNPRLTLGELAGARVQLGVTKGGNGSYLSLIDTADKERASLTAEADRTQLSLNDSQMRADLGTNAEEPDGAGLVIGKDDIDFVRMKFDPAVGGRVMVGNPAGQNVAGILSNEKGGRVVVTDADGGHTVGSLAGSPGGGELSLYLPDGSISAYMEASDTPEIGVTNASGAVMLTSGKEAPRMVLTDGAGTVFVQAGITTGGVGVVQTGPAGNGVAGVLGSGLKAASSIQGKAN